MDQDDGEEPINLQSSPLAISNAVDLEWLIVSIEEQLKALLNWSQSPGQPMTDAKATEGSGVEGSDGEQRKRRRLSRCRK